MPIKNSQPYNLTNQKQSHGFVLYFALYREKIFKKFFWQMLLLPVIMAGTMHCVHGAGFDNSLYQSISFSSSLTHSDRWLDNRFDLLLAQASPSSKNQDQKKNPPKDQPGKKALDSDLVLKYREMQFHYQVAKTNLWFFPVATVGSAGLGYLFIQVPPDNWWKILVHYYGWAGIGAAAVALGLSFYAIYDYSSSKNKLKRFQKDHPEFALYHQEVLPAGYAYRLLGDHAAGFGRSHGARSSDSQEYNRELFSTPLFVYFF